MGEVCVCVREQSNHPPPSRPISQLPRSVLRIGLKKLCLSQSPTSFALSRSSSPPFGALLYPLVMTDIANWKITMFHGKIHYFYGHFPVRYVTNYQRVDPKRPLRPLEKERSGPEHLWSTSLSACLREVSIEVLGAEPEPMMEIQRFKTKHLC